MIHIYILHEHTYILYIWFSTLLAKLNIFMMVYQCIVSLQSLRVPIILK